MPSCAAIALRMKALLFGSLFRNSASCSSTLKATTAVFGGLRDMLSSLACSTTSILRRFGGNHKPAAAPLLLQPAIEPLVGHLAHGRRKIVPAIRIVRRQLLLGAEQLINRRRGNHAILHPRHLEIVVPQRRGSQERPRGERRYDLGEIKGHLLRPGPVDAGDARHVAAVRPALEVAAEILG